MGAKGEKIGEFEELVLLVIAALMEKAYSVAICDELSEKAERRVKLGVVHSVLNRLEKKGLIASHLGDPTNERGGRRKRFYQLTALGASAIKESKEVRDRLWEAIPFITPGT